ncbi:MAG: hypothetical protein AAF602_10915 [Myxococcota bacterium]
MAELELREWSEGGPDTDPVLVGRTLDDTAMASLARQLRRLGALKITEDRRGLRVRTRQHVGVVQFGDLRIRIRPKMPLRTLWRLLVYGLGLDGLPTLPPSDIELDGDVPELLAGMLALEAERLWHRGLRRDYATRDAWLASPRGRVDLAVLSRSLPLTRAALPCRHHPYTADVLHNRVVSGGLQLAGRLTEARRLRSRLHRLSQTWQRICRPAVPSTALLDVVDASRTPLTAHYAPAHRLVRALVERLGPDEGMERGATLVSGALWNMATLFERAMARFLDEYASGLRVDAQHRLRDVYSVDAGPHHHRAPTPRPDLVVSRHGRPVAVVDTKYRDLSSTSLPRDIVYQMSVYGLAFGGEVPIPAIVLYAVPEGYRPDVGFTLHVAGGGERRIVLRAVPLSRLVGVLDHREEAQRLADELVGTA